MNNAQIDRQLQRDKFFNKYRAYHAKYSHRQSLDCPADPYLGLFYELLYAVLGGNPQHDYDRSHAPEHGCHAYRVPKLLQYYLLENTLFMQVLMNAPKVPKRGMIPSRKKY